MFDRKELKKRAWAHAKGYWKLPLLLSLGVLAIGLLIFVAMGTITALAPDAQVQVSDTSFSANTNDPLSVVMGFIIMIIYMLFVAAVMMAFYYFYLQFSRDNKGTTARTFFEGFAFWHKGFRGLFWEGLWITLWSLLLYIPGIIKMFAYSQMFFVMVDKPHVGVCKSMRISKEITKGYKGDLFFMSLSFIGWLLLAMIPYLIGFVLYIQSPETYLFALFIGLFLYMVIFVILMPYMATAFTYAYEFLLKSALERKVISYEDIGETEPSQAIGGTNV